MVEQQNNVKNQNSHNRFYEIVNPILMTVITAGWMVGTLATMVTANKFTSQILENRLREEEKRIIVLPNGVRLRDNNLDGSPEDRMENDYRLGFEYWVPLTEEEKKMYEAHK